MAPLFRYLIYLSGYCCFPTCKGLLDGVTSSSLDNVFHLINQLQTQVNTLQVQVNSQQSLIQSQTSEIKACTNNLTNINSRIFSLEQNIQALETKRNPVAFFVRLINTINNHHQSSIVVFDNVILNIGNAYDKNVGIFVSPQRGIYRFEMVLSASVANGHVDIVHNGQRMLTVIADHYVDNLYGAGSGSVVLHLEQSDKVWIQFTDTGTTEINGGHVTAFSGFLIDDM